MTQTGTDADRNSPAPRPDRSGEAGRIARIDGLVAIACHEQKRRGATIDVIDGLGVGPLIVPDRR